MLGDVFPKFFPLVFKTSYLVFVIPTILVLVSAVLSVQQIGGTLGDGLKKVAAGSIIHTVLIMTYLALERGFKGLLTDYYVSLFFLCGGIIGAALLVSGYVSVYKIAKKLKLLTP